MLDHRLIYSFAGHIPRVPLSAKVGSPAFLGWPKNLASLTVGIAVGFNPCNALAKVYDKAAFD